MKLGRVNLLALPRLFRGLFADEIEESLPIRLIVLAIGWWVALSMGWVGSPAWIWLGGTLLLTGGHAFSWFFRKWKSRVRSIVVGIAVVGALSLVHRTVLLALNGDWLPVAHFLLLFQSITGFELRTRGGLYTSMGVSGVIFFLVSQIALDAAFGVFLTGFITLVLSFLAMSALVDQARKAQVRWFQSRLSFAWFWSAVAAASLALPAAIFLILPKNLDDPIRNAEAAILPLRASADLELPQILPGQGPAASAMPLTPSDVRRALDLLSRVSPDLVPEGSDRPVTASGVKQALEALQGIPLDRVLEGVTPGDIQQAVEALQDIPPDRVPEGLTPGDIQQAVEALGELQSGLGSPALTLPVRLSTTEQGPGPGEGASLEVAAGPGRGEPSVERTGEGGGEPYADDTTVMQVRSRVLTYWRGQAFSIFDGVRWHADPDYLFVSSVGPTGARLRAPGWRSLQRSPLYRQTYFLNEGVPRGSIFNGYAPVLAFVPLDEHGAPALVDGTVYRVVSALPDFTTSGLAFASQRSRLDHRYHQIPDSVGELKVLGEQITPGAFNNLERARRLVTYLDRNYRFDADAPDQLELTTSPDEFLARGSTGTSMDFATATVMLARAAGIPARLVTGYLPGAFDPLSGTYVVRAKDRHAWAELYFGAFGWVPFDSSPRLGAGGYAEGGFYRSRWVHSLFSIGYGDAVSGAIGSSPEAMADILSGAFGGGGRAFAIVAGAAVLIIAGAILLWKLPVILRRRAQRARYTRLAGEGRAEMLRIYFAAEKLFRRAGLQLAPPGRRSRNTTRRWSQA